MTAFLSALPTLLKMGLLVAGFMAKKYLDPRLILKREEKRSEDERMAFRKALYAGDADSVSRLLDGRLRRLRAKNHISNRK